MPISTFLVVSFEVWYLGGYRWHIPVAAGLVSAAAVYFLFMRVPSSPPLAVLLGALLMFGLQPGPRLFQQDPQFVRTVIANMYVGNVILLALNLPLVGVWARIALIPFPILGPIILLCSVIGAYSVRSLLFDV